MRLLTLLALLLLCPASTAGYGNASAARRALARRGDDERLPGWKGEQATPRRRKLTMGEVYSREDRERGTWIEVLSWRPRAFLIHNLMSPEECTALIKTARPFMARSTVVDSVTGESKVDPIRTRRVGRASPTRGPA
jgi:hypothetical protein